jgi:hypothetical protein
MNMQTSRVITNDCTEGAGSDFFCKVFLLSVTTYEKERKMLIVTNYFHPMAFVVLVPSLACFIINLLVFLYVDTSSRLTN